MNIENKSAVGFLVERAVQYYILSKIKNTWLEILKLNPSVKDAAKISILFMIAIKLVNITKKKKILYYLGCRDMEVLTILKDMAERFK
jgi:hypothetical protein